MAGEQRSPPRRVAAASDAAPCCWVLLALMLSLAVLSSLADAGPPEERGGGGTLVVHGPRLLGTRPCEEIYVVGEGETLHSISARCGDPYILERNPHVHDHDDVFPGLVIRITPSPAGTHPEHGSK